MSWTRYLFRDFLSAIELNQIEEDRRRTGRARRTRLRKQMQEQEATREQVDDLERELAQVKLLARALADLCIQKGLMSAEELTLRAVELTPRDESDADGDGAVS